MSSPTILVEDHRLMRETLSQFLTDVAEIDLIAAVATGEEALKICKDKEIHFALIDLSLPEMSGIELVRMLRAQCPGVACLVLSAHQEIGYIQRALANGARGYVLKGNPGELLEAIRQVRNGEAYLSEPIRDKLTAAGY